MTDNESRPTVTIAIPVLNEASHIGRCLDAVAAQTYRDVIEVLVVDGGSTDCTRELVRARGGTVRLLANPRRIQAAALNVALGEARGDILVRVDGHCAIAPDYIERCVAALQGSGAAMVGGAMRPQADGWLQEGIAAAMMSPLGAGPARFHVGGAATWVDTVYLGAYWTPLAREVGGYREDVGVNEDAEFAIRMRSGGGIRFDPSIRSTYTPRSTIKAVASQFYRYGRSRAATVRRHPSSLAPRQMAAPLLLVGLLTPWRRRVAAGYAGLVLVAGATKLVTRPRSAAGFTLAIPAMHLPWATGFIFGLVRGSYRLASDGAPATPVVDPAGACAEVA